MAEICNKCGKMIIALALEIPTHLFEDEFYCDECYDKVSQKFCLGN